MDDGCCRGDTQTVVDTSKTASVDGKTPADPVSKVLDDENLLGAILICLGFPADRGFLSHFRERHPLPYLQRLPSSVLFDNKIYMPSYPNAIFVLDLTASSISTIQLPQGVENGERDTMFGRADDDCRLYLIHAEKLQLHIWLLNGDSWSLLDSICLHEMCANLGMSDCTDRDEHTPLLRINHVGDNTEFVVLQIARCIFFLDINCRTLRKVYQILQKQIHVCVLSILL